MGYYLSRIGAIIVLVSIIVAVTFFLLAIWSDGAIVAKLAGTGGVFAGISFVLAMPVAISWDEVSKPYRAPKVRKDRF